MSRKISKAKRLSGYSSYGVTCDAIFAQIPTYVLDRCTSTEIAEIAKAINTAYHNGRASTGCEMVDANAVWINSANKLIEWDIDIHGNAHKARFTK